MNDPSLLRSLIVAAPLGLVVVALSYFGLRALLRFAGREFNHYAGPRKCPHCGKDLPN